jgi:hypothetical protein
VNLSGKATRRLSLAELAMDCAGTLSNPSIRISDLDGNDIQNFRVDQNLLRRVLVNPKVSSKKNHQTGSLRLQRVTRSPKKL